ncbi:hypothetical protein BDQ17DRAFT_1408386 [Cyathus striatus]|nr:hypothetical protein BDQ17DRAFT_1408386 [Cyathus striatus]
MAGKNQYTECHEFRFFGNLHEDAPANDPIFLEAMEKYHREAITNRNEISECLLAEYGLKVSPATVVRRRKAMGLNAGGLTTKYTPELVKRQAVLDAMAADPAGNQGPRTMREDIARKNGLILTRDYVTAEMKRQAPQGFETRRPEIKKPRRVALVSLGPNHEWSADGHDKLAAIGFPIWGVRDKWSGKWLGLWVVPNNRLKLSIGYLYLDLIEKIGGIPIQMTTDCGSELGKIFELSNALRELFARDLSIDELPPHVFIKSVHNIVIERGWLRLRLQWGENVKIFYEGGKHLFNPMDLKQNNLVQWLWPKLIQQELDELLVKFNSHRVRFDHNKKLPSGTSPNAAYSLFEKYGAEDCGTEVDTEVIRHLKDKIGGKDLIRFVSEEYEHKAQGIYDTLNISKLSFDNIWNVYSEMLTMV